MESLENARPLLHRNAWSVVCHRDAHRPVALDNVDLDGSPAWRVAERVVEQVVKDAFETPVPIRYDDPGTAANVDADAALGSMRGDAARGSLEHRSDVH